MSFCKHHLNTYSDDPSLLAKFFTMDANINLYCLDDSGRKKLASVYTRDIFIIRNHERIKRLHGHLPR